MNFKDSDKKEVKKKMSDSKVRHLTILTREPDSTVVLSGTEFAGREPAPRTDRFYHEGDLT